MKLVAAFLRLIRWPNLVFIALTQVLFEYTVYRGIYPMQLRYAGENEQFWCLLIASVLIAAAGYAINDYFDLNIDQVNKPNKVVVNVIINRRWVIIWHLFLSLTGLIFTFYALSSFKYWPLTLANILSVFLLLFYSTTLKKRLLTGNILISVLTAWVILIIFFSKNNFWGSDGTDVLYARFFRVAAIYSCFAFIISLVREVVKDMEDVEGDRRYGCKTMPIVWGMNASKVFVAVWLIVLMAALGIIVFYLLHFGWWWAVMYSIALIFLPLVWVFVKLSTARSSKNFHQLSAVVKLVMLSGILSMLLYQVYR